MSEVYPIRFRPLFRRYLWGGRRLASVLNKAIGEETCAESWEIVDHGEDQSIVAEGPLAGTPLQQLVQEHGEALLGKHYPQKQFPLLWKFLDAQKTLSLQVHPDDASAAQLDPPDLGKTEAWVVMAAEPGSLIYAGLKRGFDRQSLEREINRGTSELCLHSFEPNVGDCVFIPAGTVHAIGAGLLVAEIQQASDTTYRLYDWNRVGADGKPRELRIQAGLDSINYERGPAGAQVPKQTDRPYVHNLVECDKFVLNRWRFDSKQSAGGDQRFRIFACIDGACLVDGDPSGQPLVAGDTILLPAACGPVEMRPELSTTLLEAYLQ